MNTPKIIIDLSNADGVTTLESFQVTDYNNEAGLVQFLDIQNVNGTDISLVDTNIDHEFTYDKGNAYDAPANPIDAVDLRVQEVDGSTITFSNDRPFESGQSNVEKVNLTSASRTQISTTDYNYIQALNVGADFDMLHINGDADLEIKASLDENIRVIDAGALAADLALKVGDRGQDVGTNLAVGTFSYTGAQGDDTLDLVRTGANGNDGNADINLNTGNDSLTVFGNGNLTIVGGLGNDTVSITADQDFAEESRSANSHTDDGRHNIDLGAGNDRLTIVGNVDDYNTQDDLTTSPVHEGADDGVTTIVAGTGNDSVTITGNGEYSIDLGDNEDRLEITGNGNQTVTAGLGNDTVGIYGNGNNVVNLNDGNDLLKIIGNGNQNVTAGLGNDTVTIDGDGDQTVTGNEGNDSITIDGVGVHNVNLGTGNDALLIDGPRVKAGNVDNTIADRMTTIIGGEGNDTVDVRFDHYLDADLGTGSDRLVLRAQDLTTDDRIVGGNGATDVDTVQLTNKGTLDVLLDDSETDSTVGIEVFDLRNANITLELTDDNFDTAQTKAITVDTRQATGEQTVDITEARLSLASGRTFKLDGGDFRDVVIADDDSINGRSTLDFDGLAIIQSMRDTLRVVGSANITAADLRNVSGLEVIELQSAANQPTRWDIQLNDRVINQTTDKAPLVIKVADEVPAGSTLYITLDPSVHAGSTNDVQIIRNSNIKVYITDATNGLVNHLVTADEFGNRDFDTGTFSITVTSPLEFTSNADDLIGSNGDDLFIARSLDQVQTGDSAKGNSGFDTAQFNFAVANGSATLQDQLENANFSSIERFDFNTENVVRMNGLGSGYASDLQVLVTGHASDELTNMRQGLEYRLREGNDVIRLFGNSAETRTIIDGGTGVDSVYGNSGDDRVAIQNVEFVDLFGNNSRGGGDSVELLQANPALVTILNAETIIGSAGSDLVNAGTTGANAWERTINIDGRDGNDTLSVGLNNTPTQVTAFGGSGADSITVNAISRAVVNGDDSNQFTADGNDTINVVVAGVSAGDFASVEGGGGSDVITVNVGTGDDVLGDPFVTAYVYGDKGNASVDGDDLITVRSNDHAYVEGNGGNDTITVTADAGRGSVGNASVLAGAGDDTVNVTYAVLASVDGGAGKDTITVNAVTASVAGGNGDDTIAVTVTQLASVSGGDGNDSIATSIGGDFTITGGAGNDAITLGISATVGKNTLVFGNIAYDALQVQAANTQGMDTITGFVFEGTGGDPAPAVQDVLDFSAFLTSGFTNAVTNFGTWDRASTVDANNNTGNSVVVLSSNGLSLTADDFSLGLSGTIQLNDNGRAVVIVGQDQTGSGSGIGNFDVYYVQDIDSTAGFGRQTWQVELVAHVEAATLVGVNSVLDNVLTTVSVA